MPKTFITIQEAAKLSGKSVQTIRRAIKAKKLNVKKKKTPQGFNYLVNKESLIETYKVKVEKVEEKAEKKTEKKKGKELASKKDLKISTDDFKSFTSTLEKMVNQHSEERQNFLRLVNTLQEKIIVMENQLNLLKSPKKKWYHVWR